MPNRCDVGPVGRELLDAIVVGVGYEDLLSAQDWICSNSDSIWILELPWQRAFCAPFGDADPSRGELEDVVVQIVGNVDVAGGVGVGIPHSREVADPITRERQQLATAGIEHVYSLGQAIRHINLVICDADADWGR